TELIDGGDRMVAWKDGDYEIEIGDGATSLIKVSGTKSIPLQKDWTLSFPAGWDAPDSIKLDRVGPWSEMPNNSVRHFSGTATYVTTVEIESIDRDDRYMLDLGQIGNIAKITVNGNESAVLWTWPFRADITDDLKQGENSVSIAVTNTWHNRLVLDANLAPDRRRTWTISGPPKDSPLEFSGMGPNVLLQRGKVVTLEAAD
ncbi:MAG: glycosylhydrolase-like jelly roll fold domain-containing protein, partial [Rubripirellula sp.]